MSTTEYLLNGIRYDIGTIGWEDPTKVSNAIESTIPTYGLWAGPEWSDVEGKTR
jgi:hypothetical protein